MLHFRRGIIATLLLTLCWLPNVARGEDFRIESKVFVEKEKKPRTETLTLFKGNVVYDFMLTEPNEVTIFDPQRKRIILLNPLRKVKMELSLFQLGEIIKALRARASKNLLPLTHPKLGHSFDNDSGWLTLASTEVTYRAKGSQPPKAAAARKYQEFADWYARLNAARLVGLPPFARIELNQALAARGLIPEQVELTVSMRNAPLKRKIKIKNRSQHAVIWKLSKTDHDRINRAGDDQAKFDPVNFSQYLDHEKVAARGTGGAKR